MRERKTKSCSKCKKRKQVAYFSKDKTRRDGLYPYCKRCANGLNYENYTRSRGSEYRVNQDRDRYARNKETQYWKIIKRQFGLSREDYLAIYDNQNGVCAICKQPSKFIDKRSGQPRRLAVDHCHTTGKVRGLLCNNCNTSLGMLQDDIKILESAIDYLKAHNG